MEKLTLSRKSKSHDCYEELAQEIRLLTMNTLDTERKVRIPIIIPSILTEFFFLEHQKTTHGRTNRCSS